MKHVDRAVLDQRVLTLIKARGTVCPSEVARHLKIKWETADRSLKRLVASGAIYFHPELGSSPMVYSIWPKVYEGNRFRPQPDVISQGEDSDRTDRDARLSRMRGVTDIVEERGVVCHPKTDPRNLSQEWIGSHWHGSFSIDVKTVGTMPQTFAIASLEVMGGWYSRLMPIAGNSCYYGHVKLPDDPDKFKVHCMATADGSISSMTVYVHRRYVYYMDHEKTAMEEFRQQVKDVCDVLKYFGWAFGDITPHGFYSAALNNRTFAGLMPKCHVETTDDIVKFDSSVGDADGVCTEAEIIYDHPGASDEMAVLVQAPARIMALESAVDDQSERIDGLDGKVDKLIVIAEKTLTATEISLQATQNTVPAPYIAPKQIFTAQEDVMYG